MGVIFKTCIVPKFKKLEYVEPSTRAIPEFIVLEYGGLQYHVEPEPNPSSLNSSTVDYKLLEPEPYSSLGSSSTMYYTNIILESTKLEFNAHNTPI